MTDNRFFCRIGRKVVVTGHYGSGKTEFSVSLAFLLATRTTEKLAVVDLDIINPYFRSREQKAMLLDHGICVYGSSFESEITAELPSLGANIRTPLEDDDSRVIIDCGGNDSGAIILNQFTKYLCDDTTVIAVINASRPETCTLQGALSHIAAIEAATGLTVTEIVNNSHMLSETTADTIIEGHDLCVLICNEAKKSILCNCYPKETVVPEDLASLPEALMPLGLYMRPTWLY